MNSISNYASNDKIAHNNSQESNELFTNPSLFESKTQRLICDTSQQKSWEMAVASRYDKLDGKCISPNEALDRYGPSGPGSSLKSTSSLRRMLGEFIYSHNIQTFLDAPCGDWLWMQTMNLTGLQYFGGDITNVTVQTNTRCFGNDNIHFHWFDLTCMIPPAVDLILVRDVLFHLPEDLVYTILIISINREQNTLLRLHFHWVPMETFKLVWRIKKRDPNELERNWNQPLDFSG